MLEVVFAPDWRNGVPYQGLLATALQRYGVNVHFLQGYRRVLPLSRLLKAQQVDVLHLHWPEAYYLTKGAAFDDWFRRARFPFDLAGAIRQCALAATAHNFYPHNRANETFVKRNTQCFYANARVIFAHSDVAKRRLVETFKLSAEKVRVIPHGDLSIALGGPLPVREARRELGLNPGKIALMFGAIEPYKGLEEIIAWWQWAHPDLKLAIVGKPCSQQYASLIACRIGNAKNIIQNLSWISDEVLRFWLSAADVVVFNYRNVVTSGAACLARSFGVPILLPNRLDTVDLGEPTPYVRRFTDVAGDFGEQLIAALRLQPDFDTAASWREACNWDKIACLTADAYRCIVG